MKKLIYTNIFWVSFMVIFLIHPLNCAAQTDNVTVPDNDPGQPDLSPHSLYAGLGYGNNMIYLGSTISQNQPYVYTTLTYGYRDMLYISLAPVHLAERNPFIAFNMTSVSFSHVFNSWFDISAASSYYHVAPSLRDTLFGNFLYTDVTFGFDWKILYSKLSAGGMFSEDNNVFFQIRNSRYFQTPGFTSKDLFFAFDPYVNLICGSLTTMETDTGSPVQISPPFWKNGRNSQHSTNTEYSSSFRCLEIDFGIPVSFNSSSFTIEAEPGYVLPLYEENEQNGTRGFILTLSLLYRISPK